MKKVLILRTLGGVLKKTPAASNTHSNNYNHYKIWDVHNNNGFGIAEYYTNISQPYDVYEKILFYNNSLPLSLSASDIKCIIGIYDKKYFTRLFIEENTTEKFPSILDPNEENFIKNIQTKTNIGIEVHFKIKRKISTYTCSQLDQMILDIKHKELGKSAPYPALCFTIEYEPNKSLINSL